MTQVGLRSGFRYTVLVVDDEADHRLLIEHTLRAEGVRVFTAGSGDEAMERLEGVDLVLLDYVLPGRSGLDTLRAIREMNGPSVILATAMGSESIAVEALRAGAVDYLMKDGRYLQSLPQVVERAWRSHDLARKAREVQRLALLVSSASDRSTTFGEIVRGARDLLRAESCLLFLLQGERIVLQECDGDLALNADDVRRRAVAALGARAPAETRLGDRHVVLVPVRAADESALGVLAVVGSPRTEIGGEELALAVTFASFCGLALAHLKQLELERSLVAELQDTLEIRRELVASVSHELRTPLTCILGFTSTLATHWFELDDDARRDFLEKVRKHGIELAELVDGLLDFASAEAGRLVASNDTIDLANEVQEALTQLGPMLAERKVTVDTEPGVASADPTLFRRTLSNLLSNAVKYSDSGTPIEISIRREGMWMRVSVTDHGVGMSPSETQRAFEPFWRAGRGIARKRGTGIGLGLVRDYVRLMGGSVSVDSTAGVGSTFSFTLPAVA